MNLYDDFPLPEPGTERFDTLFSRRGVTVERIASCDFRHGKWYDQEHDEWVVLLTGTAALEFEVRQPQKLAAGDTLLIEARTRHRVVATSHDALWLAVHVSEC